MVLKAIRGGLEGLVKTADAVKKKFEPGIDKILSLGAANMGAVYGASEIIDGSDYSDPTNAAIMLGTGALIAGGNYLALTSRGAKRLLGKINSGLDKVRPLSWAKTGLLAAGVLASGNQLKPYATQIYEDLRPDGIENIIDPGETLTALDGELGYTSLVEHDFSGTILAPKNSTIGRIQRTLRWEPIYRTVEKVYGIPENTLAGMIMQESYGDPVQPNSSNDGGLGVVHIQGTTAEQYGMKILGSSNRASDQRHGGQIREMLEECNYDPACAQEFDDRAHLIKVLDVAAGIVAVGKDKHGDWDFGVEYYRAPAKVGRNLTWRYLRDVQKWGDAISNPGLLAQAAADFETRNGSSFEKYIEKWHEMSDNWGLKQYEEMRGVN